KPTKSSPISALTAESISWSVLPSPPPLSPNWIVLNPDTSLLRSCQALSISRLIPPRVLDVRSREKMPGKSAALGSIRAVVDYHRVFETGKGFRLCCLELFSSCCSPQVCCLGRISSAL